MTVTTHSSKETALALLESLLQTPQPAEQREVAIRQYMRAMHEQGFTSEAAAEALDELITERLVVLTRHYRLRRS